MAIISTQNRKMKNCPPIAVAWEWEWEWEMGSRSVNDASEMKNAVLRKRTVPGAGSDLQLVSLHICILPQPLLPIRMITVLPITSS